MLSPTGPAPVKLLLLLTLQPLPPSPSRQFIVYCKHHWPAGGVFQSPLAARAMPIVRSTSHLLCFARSFVPLASFSDSRRWQWRAGEQASEWQTTGRPNESSSSSTSCLPHSTDDDDDDGDYVDGNRWR